MMRSGSSVWAGSAASGALTSMNGRTISRIRSPPMKISRSSALENAMTAVHRSSGRSFAYPMNRGFSVANGWPCIAAARCFRSDRAMSSFVRAEPGLAFGLIGLPIRGLFLGDFRKWIPPVHVPSDVPPGGQAAKLFLGELELGRRLDPGQAPALELSCLSHSASNTNSRFSGLSLGIFGARA